MDVRSPSLNIKILLESNPSEVQSLGTEIGRMRAALTNEIGAPDPN